METFIQQSLLSNQLSLLLLPVVLAAGVLTSLSPCVYPLLPITVGVVAGQQQQTRKQGFIYSLVYVSGLAIVYGLMGVVAALTGQLFGSVASHPLTLFIVANCLLLMAVWMQGWLQLPNVAVQFPYANQITNRYLQLFSLGALSGLIAAPCTSPVLGMLLIYVASHGNPIWGALLLIIFAYGMSTLLILVGTFSSLLQRLPRSGRWLNISKSFLALMLLGISQYLLMMSGRGL